MYSITGRRGVSSKIKCLNFVPKKDKVKEILNLIATKTKIALCKTLSKFVKNVRIPKLPGQNKEQTLRL